MTDDHFASLFLHAWITSFPADISFLVPRIQP